MAPMVSVIEGFHCSKCFSAYQAKLDSPSFIIIKSNPSHTLTGVSEHVYSSDGMLVGVVEFLGGFALLLYLMIYLPQSEVQIPLKLPINH